MKNSKTNNPIPGSYNGRLYLRIATDDVFSDMQIFSMLNDLSDQIINEIGSNITTWVFSSHLNAFKCILEIQKKDFTFRLMGENDLLFIAYKW